MSHQAVTMFTCDVCGDRSEGTYQGPDDDATIPPGWLTVTVTQASAPHDVDLKWDACAPCRETIIRALKAIKAKRVKHMPANTVEVL